MSMQLKLTAVDKFYGSVSTGVHAVQNINMEVEKGEIIALLGSSGCGKTSILRMIAGFEETTRGTIELAGRQIQTLLPVRRNVAMAFEGYSLYPTVTLGENIAFALKAAKLPAGETASRVKEVTEMLEITDILDRYPSSVSGGQQQRASLARALIRDADLHLLDEPMGQLEPQLRTLLRGRIKHYIKERGLTAILVTHDQTEANALADRIAVMEGGVLQQYATPKEIKEAPANLFTGTFVGEPPMNVFRARVQAVDGQLQLDLGQGLNLSYSVDAFAPKVREALLAHQDVMLGVRPYAVHRSKNRSKNRGENRGENGDENRAVAQVIANQWLGDQTHIAATFAGGTIVLVEHDRANISVGDAISVRIAPEDLHVFDATSGVAISHGVQMA